MYSNLSNSDLDFLDSYLDFLNLVTNLWVCMEQVWLPLLYLYRIVGKLTRKQLTFAQHFPSYNKCSFECLKWLDVLRYCMCIFPYLFLSQVWIAFWHILIGVFRAALWIINAFGVIIMSLFWVSRILFDTFCITCSEMLLIALFVPSPTQQWEGVDILFLVC